MKIFTTICLILCLSSCSVFTKDLSSGQRYFAAKQDLESLLSAAVQYKSICYERISTDPCYKQVELIKKLKPKISSTFNLAESYRIQKDESMLLASATALSKIAVELSSYLIQLKQEVTNGS